MFYRIRLFFVLKIQVLHRMKHSSIEINKSCRKNEFIILRTPTVPVIWVSVIWVGDVLFVQRCLMPAFKCLSVWEIGDLFDNTVNKNLNIR